MAYKVEITRWWHDGSETTGYAEVTLNGRELTASWATYGPLGGLLYDTWLDTTASQNQAIAKALNDIHAVPKVRLHKRSSNKSVRATK